MPFTFSHPAIVLPLALLPRRWFSLTGLVVGSITPDFEYFLRMKVRSNYSHTIEGIFWFNLPLGLMLAFLFHHLVRDSFFENLPPFIKDRLEHYKEFSWGAYFKTNWVVVLLSLWIGVVSHLLWDSFTHEHGYFVSAFPTLTQLVNISGTWVPAFKVLQHSSTFIGGIVIVIALGRLPARKNKNQSQRLRYWITLTTIVAMVVAARILSGLDYRLYGHLIVTAIAGLLLALVLTPLCLRSNKIESKADG